ncbi:MAG TPA: proline dehydrogenase family protein [Candidatus Binatia bacterium]|nr:proline dehydrogenase family protein [Candidatus Binatia bacterium]
MNPLRTVLLALSTRPRIGEWMERVPATRRLVRRFVAGPTAEDALAVVERLNAAGILGAVTYLGENVRTPAEAEHAAQVYVELLDEIKRRNLQALPSLKLTHLGLDLGLEPCLRNLGRVLERGRATGTRVWIDMESSAYTDRTLDLYARLRPEHPHLACVVQAYLRRTPADVERLIDLGATVRLCKGAYREPPAIAYPDKRDVDAAYARLADRLLAPDALARGVYTGFATHDERLIARVRERAAERRLAAGRFEVQMLYGIRADLHARLLAEEVPLRVLVPFGEDWYGYFMRRLAERPANLAFLLKNLARG